MIQIKITGFKNQTVELETQNQALAFLTGLKQEHTAFLAPLIRKIEYNAGLKNSTNATFKEAETKRYTTKLRAITSKHPLKVEISEFDADMEGLV